MLDEDYSRTNFNAVKNIIKITTENNENNSLLIIST